MPWNESTKMDEKLKFVTSNRYIMCKSKKTWGLNVQQGKRS